MSSMTAITTPKAKAKLKSDIEKCREEGSWQKVLQLASQLQSNPNEQALIPFLLGESKLELYLELCGIEPKHNHQNVLSQTSQTSSFQQSISGGLSSSAATTTTITSSAATSGISSAGGSIITSNQNSTTALNAYSGENREKLLNEAEEHLHDCLVTSSASPLCMDAALLLAKTHYARGDYQKTVHAIEVSGIEMVTQVEKTLPLRVMKLVAESFAIKGLALEHLANQNLLNQSSNQSQAMSSYSSPSAFSDYRKHSSAASSSASSIDSVAQITSPSTGVSTAAVDSSNTIETRIFCLARSTDLTLRYLQNMEKQHGPYLLSSVDQILESAMHKTPLLYVRNGQLMQAVNQYRSLMNSVECKSTLNFKQTVARQLTEVIMRGVTRCQWAPIDSSILNDTGAWRPHRYNGQTLFQPAQREEEILLLLQIAENQAAANVVLDRSYEFARARKESLNNVIAIHDLFATAFTPHRHFAIDMFERAMKFSFEVQHVWFQFALALHQTGQALRCSKVLAECIRNEPEDPLPLMFQAKLHLQQLSDPEQALQFAEEAMNLLQNSVPANSVTSGAGMGSQATTNQLLLNRCHLLIGVCCAIIYEQQGELHRPLHKKFLQRSLQSFRKMVISNPNDHLPYFHIALHLARQREIKQAVAHLQIALALNPAHLPTIHLLLVCLSALQRHREAHVLCESALLEFPGQLLLLFIKAHLETQLTEDGDQQALLTAKEMLRCCRKLTTGLATSAASTTRINGTVGATMVDGANRTLSTKDSSYYLTGVNCDTLSLRLEQTLSEAACIDSSGPMLGEQLVSELSEGNIGALHHSQSSAALCSASVSGVITAQPASGSLNLPSNYLQGGSTSSSNAPINAQLGAMQMRVWLMVAELFIRLGQLNEAEQCLTENVQTHAGYLSHQLLYVRGRLCLARGQPFEAKILLQNAISINPRHAPALQQLGLAYHYMGNHQIADKYLRDSLNCDSSCVQTWSIMGDVLDALGDHERAVNCHMTALKLEQIQPVLPFSIIPRVVLD